MGSREELRNAIKQYVYTLWNMSDEETIERLLAGTMAFIAVELWDKPFTPMVPPVILEEQKIEEEDGQA